MHCAEPTCETKPKWQVMLRLVDAAGNDVGRVGMPLGVCEDHKVMPLKDLIGEAAWEQVTAAVVKAGLAAPDPARSFMEYVELAEPGPVTLAAAAARVFAAVNMLAAASGREPMVQASRHLADVSRRSSAVFFHDPVGVEPRHALAEAYLKLAAEADGLANACLAQDADDPESVQRTEEAGTRVRLACREVGTLTPAAVARQPGD